MIRRILFSSLLFCATILSAQGYFITHGDICKQAVDHYCPNEPEVVKNLQLALASDRHLKRVIKMDGIFGNDTHEAIIAFQKYIRLIQQMAG
jgi:peptidoglycan hydrolase-like protein with peptidoglycan-binding domain